MGAAAVLDRNPGGFFVRRELRERSSERLFGLSVESQAWQGPLSNSCALRLTVTSERGQEDAEPKRLTGKEEEKEWCGLGSVNGQVDKKKAVRGSGTVASRREAEILAE